MNDREKQIFIRGVVAGLEAGQNLTPDVSLSALPKEKAEKEKRVYKKRSRKWGGKRSPQMEWTPEEDQLLMENRILKVKKMAELLPGRTPSAIQTRRFKIGATKIFGKQEQPTEEGLSNLIPDRE